MISRTPSQASTTAAVQHSATPSAATLEPPSPTPSSPTANANTPAPLKSNNSREPLHIATPATAGPEPTRRTSLNTTPRSISMTLSGDVPAEDEAIGSPVMHETLSVIDEHITDMSAPRQSQNAAAKDLRAGNDSGSEYSSHHRLSSGYVNGNETDEEENGTLTEAEVRTWSPARVADYLESVGVEKRHCDVFREQEIDGEALLGVDRNLIFMQEFELGPMGPRLRTWLRINDLQVAVKSNKEDARGLQAAPSMDALDDYNNNNNSEGARMRAASTGSALPRTMRASMGSRDSTMRHSTMPMPMPRAASTAGRSLIDSTSPLIQHTPASPPQGSPIRPSAASVRSMNHNRRHSSIDYNQSGLPTPASPGSAMPPPNIPGPSTHKKTPSFDRGWTMGSPQKSPQEMRRPSSSHHAYSNSANGTAFDAREAGMNDAADLDRGYFSGGELDSRKNRNVLRKRDSTGGHNHTRTASYTTEPGTRQRTSSFSRRHSRIGSADAIAPSGHTSAASKAYFGGGGKSERTSGTFDFVRPLKPMNESNPTVTKLTYDSHSIDAIANSPAIPSSETSSTGRASPSPAAHTSSKSFFKKPRAVGLRAISDAITGGEKASASTSDMASKDSAVQSPTRTGSTTPSGTSVSKSFEIDKADANRRHTSSSTAKDAKKKAKKHGTSAYLKGRQQIPPTVAMENCDYSGWMKKKSSSLMTTWKTRLFVLRGRRLAYYYSENDVEERGLIDISSHRVLPANDERMTGLHATITRAASSPSSPHNATIQTTASTDSANGIEEDMSGMFIFKLVPPRAGLQRGVQFTKPIVHYFAVDNLALGRLWMAALMKATIDRDEALPFTTTYQQKTISLEKARAMRQRPPNLMDDDELETASGDAEKKSEYSKESIQGSIIHEEDEKGLAITGLDDAKAILSYAEDKDSTTAGSSPEKTMPAVAT